VSDSGRLSMKIKKIFMSEENDMGVEEAAIREWFLARDGKVVYGTPRIRSGVTVIVPKGGDVVIGIYWGIVHDLVKLVTVEGVRFFDTREERDEYEKQEL